MIEEYAFEFTMTDPAGKEVFVFSGETTDPQYVSLSQEMTLFGITIPAAKNVRFIRQAIRES